jgi:hypothetical protein
MKRSFIIKYIKPNNDCRYIKEIIKYHLGYRFFPTSKIEDSQIYTNKKIVDKVVIKLNNGLFEPGFDKNENSTYKYEIVEVTPTKTLRVLKLKNISKKLNLL